MLAAMGQPGRRHGSRPCSSRSAWPIAADDRFREYSMGMKQRLGIAGALLGDPELLILDEPTNGLDPVGMREIRQLIADIASAERTVLVSSHLLSEIEQVCDWLIVIERRRRCLRRAGGRVRRRGHGHASPSRPSTPPTSSSSDQLLRRRGPRRRRGRRARCSSPSTTAIPGTSAAGINRLAHEHGLVLAELRAAPSQLAGPLPLPRRRRPPMIRSIRAELVKLTRPRFVAVTLRRDDRRRRRPDGRRRAHRRGTARPAADRRRRAADSSIEALGDAGGGTAVVRPDRRLRGRVPARRVHRHRRRRADAGHVPHDAAAAAGPGPGARRARSSPSSASRRCWPWWPRRWRG